MPNSWNGQVRIFSARLRYIAALGALIFAVSVLGSTSARAQGWSPSPTGWLSNVSGTYQMTGEPYDVTYPFSQSLITFQESQDDLLPTSHFYVGCDGNVGMWDENYTGPTVAPEPSPGNPWPTGDVPGGAYSGNIITVIDAAEWIPAGSGDTLPNSTLTLDTEYYYGSNGGGGAVTGWSGDNLYQATGTQSPTGYPGAFQIAGAYGPNDDYLFFTGATAPLISWTSLSEVQGWVAHPGTAPDNFTVTTASSTYGTAYIFTAPTVTMYQGYNAGYGTNMVIALIPTGPGG